MIKMLQWVITNMLETNISVGKEIKCLNREIEKNIRE